LKAAQKRLGPLLTTARRGVAPVTLDHPDLGLDITRDRSTIAAGSTLPFIDDVVVVRLGRGNSMRASGRSASQFALAVGLALCGTLLVVRPAQAIVDPRGTYLEVTHLGCCTDFHHTLFITNFDFVTGQFTGTGTNSPFAFTGQLIGSHITLHTTSPGSSYVSDLDGMFQSDRSMSGTWTDNLGQSGTWTALPTPTLWLGNDMSGDVFATDLSGRPVTDLGNLPRTGIAFDGTYLYFGDRGGNIEQRTSDGQLVLKSFNIPISGCCAEDLAWDTKRQRLWRIDHGNVLHVIDVNSGTEDRSFSLPTTDPGGILTPLGGLGIAYDPGRDLLYVSFCQQGCVLNGKGIVETVDPSKGAVTGVLCLLYTSPSPRDLSTSRMPSSA